MSMILWVLLIGGFFYLMMRGGCCGGHSRKHGAGHGCGASHEGEPHAPAGDEHG